MSDPLALEEEGSDPWWLSDSYMPWFLAQAKCLDDALALWKKLLAKKGVPVVRSAEQTVVSLHILAALYRMMAKVFGALGSDGLGRWLRHSLVALRAIQHER